MSGFYKIPNNYRRNDLEMIPAYLKGYEHFFYANLDETIDDADFSDWILSIFDNTGTEVVSNVAPLIQDVISGSDYRFYCEFSIAESMPNGVYYFVVYNSQTDELKYVSNCFRAITIAEVEEYVLLFFRNSSNQFNFNYQVVDNYNSIFLPMNLIEQQPEIELQQYVEQTTGKRRNQRSITSKVIKLESYLFDDEANDMMLALSVHDDIVVNGKVVDVKTAHQIITNRFNGEQKGEIEFYDQEFSTINLNG